MWSSKPENKDKGFSVFQPTWSKSIAFSSSEINLTSGTGWTASRFLMCEFEQTA